MTAMGDSQQNIELLRPIYAAWKQGDFTDASWAHPEIELVSADGLDAGATWTGVAGMARGWHEWLSTWEEYRVEVEEYRELDDERVLVLMLHCGRGKASGVDVGQMGESGKRAGANVVHLRDGKVVKIVLYWDRERALADLGIAA
jgi:hypothetical protein